MDIVEFAKLGSKALREKKGAGYVEYMKELSKKAAAARALNAEKRKTEAKNTP